MNKVFINSNNPLHPYKKHKLLKKLFQENTTNIYSTTPILQRNHSILIQIYNIHTATSGVWQLEDK